MATMLMSHCTVLSRSPAPRKLSVAAAIQFREQPPSVVALPWASSFAYAACNKESRSYRSPLFTCHANKYNYSDLQPNALEACTLYSFEGKGTGGSGGTEAAALKASTLLAGENWTIMGDKDVIILKLRVGESPPEKFRVGTAPDQAGLVIRYHHTAAGGGGAGDDNPASELNVSLTMPRGYDSNKVQAKCFQDWLLVMVAKPKPDPNPITVHP